MWTYRKLPATLGFVLFTPAEREVGVITNEPDAREITTMLNEALHARLVK